MKKRYFRNNETDFCKWSRRYVRKALYDVEHFENNQYSINLILFKDEYYNALEIVRQYTTIKSALPEDYQRFLDECLIGKKAYDLTKENILIYREIFHIWQEVCFPQNRSSIKSVDAFLLGHLLRAERLKLCMSVKQVSDLVSISPKTLYSYEEGFRLIRLDILYKLSQIYGFSLDKILNLTL